MDMVLNIPGCIEKIALAIFGRCLVPEITFTRQFLKTEYSAKVVQVVQEELRKAKDPVLPVYVALLGGVRT